MSVQKLRFNLDINVIKEMYSKGSCLKDIAIFLGVSSKAISLRLLKNNIPLRGLSESHIVSEKFKESIKNRKSCIRWNKGLTKENPKIKAAMEKGRLTQIKNGKSKGKNNPMYGKPATHSKAGFRVDLGHSVRSSWEANFARILNYLKLPYDYEKETFKLNEEDTYTPDFYIKSKDKYYEIKGYERNDKFLRFKNQYPDKNIIYVNEKFYNKLMKLFGNKIVLDSNFYPLTKKEINDKFLKFYEDEDSDTRISVSDFCKKIGISNKLIIRIYGSVNSIKVINQEQLKKIDKERLKNKFLSFVEIYKKYPNIVEFKNFYPRTPTLLKRVYGNYKISEIFNDLNVKKKNLPWTLEEDLKLKENYNNKNINLILLNRTNYSIKNRMSFLRLVREKQDYLWSEEDKELLKKMYPVESKEYLLEKIKNKTWRAISGKANKLNIKKIERWNEKELTILEELYADSTKEYLLEKLPNRSWCSISIKASFLNIKRKYI